MNVIDGTAHSSIGHAFEDGCPGIVRVTRNIAGQFALYPECDVTYSSDK